MNNVENNFEAPEPTKNFRQFVDNLSLYECVDRVADLLDFNQYSQ